MKQETSDFWQDHSLRYLEMAFRTDKRQRLEKPDGYGKRTGICGDTVEFFLLIQDKNIQSICFYATGCINTNACCNAVTLLVEGKSLSQAWEVTADTVVNYLETLPQDHFHCAELAVGALYLALSNYQDLQRSPWKKIYQGI